MRDYSHIDQYLQDNLEESIGELSRLCAQPSIAAQNIGIEETAKIVADLLKKRGFTVDVIPTQGAPVVFAVREAAVKNASTLLFYDHYDVQPADPLDLWDSPPFEPSLRDGKLFARGVSDNKGHFTSRLLAIDALLNSEGELPCNVKFIVEGEEEIGSINLPKFIEQNQKLLAADACIWEFGQVDFNEVPLQQLGMRGICYVELSISTASIDVHSGLGGSIFPNAAWRLVWALNSLKDKDERILLPGFYDSVIPPSDNDIELLKLLPDRSEDFTSRYGVSKFLKGLYGGFELIQAQLFEPTCTICGLTSGYQGLGSKTVLPAKASAKIDFRLVPNQTPDLILTQLRSHLDICGFQDIDIQFLGGGPPARTDPDDPFVKLVIKSAEQVYDSHVDIIPMIGGSGPNHPFIHTLNLPVASSGIGYAGANGHAPNENIRLDLYLKGAKHITRILNDFGIS